MVRLDRSMLLNTTDECSRRNASLFSYGSEVFGGG